MEGWAAAAAYTAAALACAAAATVVALRLIYRHLLHYSEPTHQRFIVRIIFMVPARMELDPNKVLSNAKLEKLFPVTEIVQHAN